MELEIVYCVSINTNTILVKMYSLKRIMSVIRGIVNKEFLNDKCNIKTFII
jgi:hypothetical protein